jgi:hypothetical protein
VPSSVDGVRPRRGRPRKFTTPSRAVTLTLPEDVIAALGSIDRDLSRAVAQLTQPILGTRPHAPAELAVFGKRAVILVQPSRRLERQIGVDLVPLPDGRALIAFDQPMTIAQLELMLQDVIERHDLPPADQQTFEAILEILRSARRSQTVRLRQRNIILLEAVRGAMSPARRRTLARRSNRTATVMNPKG